MWVRERGGGVGGECHIRKPGEAKGQEKKVKEAGRNRINEGDKGCKIGRVSAFTGRPDDCYTSKRSSPLTSSLPPEKSKDNLRKRS